MDDTTVNKLIKLKNRGLTWEQMLPQFKGYSANALRKTYYRNLRKIKNVKLKVLLLDIETAPMLGYVWGLWENNVSLNQVKADWHVLSWSAKWLGDSPDKVMYMDQRSEKHIEDDSKILKGIWKLMNEADVIIGQNSKRFDIKKLNARFILNGITKPSSFRQIDTMELAKKHFAFTSNKLEYMTDKLCTKYKKLKHSKFSGFELWRQCMAGNLAAWKEMEKYNKYDVLSLEELYNKLAPWNDNSINVNINHDETHHSCPSCNGTEFTKNGFKYTNTGKFQRYSCVSCGHESRDKTNLLTKEKLKSLRG